MTFLRKRGGILMVVVGILLLAATILGRPLLEKLLTPKGFAILLPTIVNVLLILSLLLIFTGVFFYVRRLRRQSRY